MTAARKDILWRVLVFVAAAACWLLHHHYVFLGFYGNDDYNYVRLAHGYLQGINLKQGADSYSLRELPVISAAFWFRWMGYTENAFRMYALSSLLLTGSGVALIMRGKSFFAYALSVVLYFGSYSLLFYSHRLLPDAGIVLLASLAFAFYHMARFPARLRQAEGWKGGGFAIALFLAMVTKETVLLLLPLLAWWLVSDIRKRRLKAFWFWSLGTGTALIVIYFLLYDAATGDPLRRIQVLQQSGYENICRFDLLPFTYTLKRITIDLVYAWMLNGDMLLLGLLAMAFIYRKKIIPDAAGRLIVDAGFILLISANFMSISFTHYVPLCQDPRHFIFLLPFGAMAGALLLDAYRVKPFAFPGLPVFFGLLAATLFLLRAGEMKYIYLLFAAWLTAISLLQRRLPIFVMNRFAMGALVLALLIRPAYDIYGKKDAPYLELKAMVGSTAMQGIHSATIYAPDLMTTELASWFQGFQPHGNAWVSLDTLGQREVVRGKAYLLSTEEANPVLHNWARHLANDTISGKSLLTLHSSSQVDLYWIRDAWVLDSLRAILPPKKFITP